MKPLTVHPGSALAGAGVLALVLLGTGVAAPQGVAQALTAQRINIENIADFNSYPNPRNYVVIENGTPYVVPTGKILALTALGSKDSSASIVLKIDSVEMVTASGRIGSSQGFGGNATTMRLLPPGLRATAGQTVEVSDSDGRAWGFLVDA